MPLPPPHARVRHTFFRAHGAAKRRSRMLVRDYERAKALAGTDSDEALSERIRRFDRLSLYLAVAGLASFALLFCGDAIRNAAPAFFSVHASLWRIVTTLLPALGLAAFLIGGDIIRGRRGVVELARRLKSERGGEGEPSCRRG